MHTLADHSSPSNHKAAELAHRTGIHVGCTGLPWTTVLVSSVYPLVAAMSGGRSINGDDTLPNHASNLFSVVSDEKMKTSTGKEADLQRTLKLKKLTVDQVRHIDEILASLGDYGELHLIIQNGELRYINKVESFSARKSEPKE